ncbi:MAG TPA: NAD(P)-dependent oxidoreductase [Solirubrobacterales bacterium]|nr:NAD(P)-dependent oxidoreductase [Solirubrobacterales bacterium]
MAGPGAHTYAVTNRLPEPAMEMLRGAGEVRADQREMAIPREDLLALVDGAEAILTLLHDRVDDELLEAAGPQLRCVANVAVGYDNVDVEAAARRGVVVTNTPGVLDDATADLTLALLLAATRRVAEGDRLVRAGRPWSWGMHFMLGSSLRGKLLGIVGLGGIGRRVAERARAFGLEIAYHQRHEAAPETVASLGARRLPLEQLLAEADVVSLHCPLTPETRHLVGAAELAAMKPTAVLVNAARGPIVDEAALAEALAAGEIAAAGLDVYEHEPRVEPELLALENVVLAPHLGSATVETRTAMAELAARNAISVLGGQGPLTPVSPQ